MKFNESLRFILLSCFITLPSSSLIRLSSSWRKVIVSTISCANLLIASPNMCHAEFARSGEFIYNDDDISSPSSSLEEQLKAVQALQVKRQTVTVLKAQKGISTEELDFIDSQIIVKGLISLAPNVDGTDKTQYPLGLESPVSYDDIFSNNKASLIITVVGKEGPPFAVKRLPLAALKFPLEFSITTDDLMFPYLEKSYFASQISKGPVACTAVLDTDGTSLFRSPFRSLFLSIYLSKLYTYNPFLFVLYSYLSCRHSSNIRQCRPFRICHL